jgi:hypothetical protein
MTPSLIVFALCSCGRGALNLRGGEHFASLPVSSCVANIVGEKWSNRSSIVRHAFDTEAVCQLGHGVRCCGRCIGASLPNVRAAKE